MIDFHTCTFKTNIATKTHAVINATTRCVLLAKLLFSILQVLLLLFLEGRKSCLRVEYNPEACESLTYAYAYEWSVLKVCFVIMQFNMECVASKVNLWLEK